jgi:hypothetical protein
MCVTKVIVTHETANPVSTGKLPLLVLISSEFASSPVRSPPRHMYAITQLPERGWSSFHVLTRTRRHNPPNPKRVGYDPTRFRSATVNNQIPFIPGLPSSSPNFHPPQTSKFALQRTGSWLSFHLSNVPYKASEYHSIAEIKCWI